MPSLSAHYNGFGHTNTGEAIEIEVKQLIRYRTQKGDTERTCNNIMSSGKFILPIFVKLVICFIYLWTTSFPLLFGANLDLLAVNGVLCIFYGLFLNFYFEKITYFVP